MSEHGNGNGTAKRALINSAIGAVFLAMAAWASNVEKRLSFCEMEAYRVGKIASGRGERLDRLEAFQRWATDKIHDLDLEMARRFPVRPTGPP